MQLYDYWRSSAAYRVRIALNLKSVSYDSVPVNIAPGADEQLKAEFRAINPQMRVPAIEVEGRVASQSMAILEWIEETWPAPPLLPADPWQRLQVRAFADTIACDIHPLNNLSPLAVLRRDFGADEAAVTRWYQDWIHRGFKALEDQVSAHPASRHLFGESISLADVVLVPQMANARRFETNLDAYPRLVAADAAARALPAFETAAPENQKH
jgi:maleylacetoacetate isomerase